MVRVAMVRVATHHAYLRIVVRPWCVSPPAAPKKFNPYIHLPIIFFSYVRILKPVKPMRIAYFLQLFFLLFFNTLKAQTTLIDPAGAGSFALGNTFESNGWTVANFDNVNGWAIGSSSGVNRAAFASSNWQDNAPLPGIGANDLGKSFHFFRDITIPANEPVLELKFKCKVTFGSLYVGIASTSYVPNASDIRVPSNLGTPLAEVAFSSQGTVIQTQIPGTFAGATVRIVFTGYYAPNAVPNAQSFGPVVHEIFLSSRPAISFQSVPGSFEWSDPNAWIPKGKGVPVGVDDVTIVSGSTISGSFSFDKINNLNIHGTLKSYISTINGNLLVKSGGFFDQKRYLLECRENFMVEEGGNVNVSEASVTFKRPNTMPPQQQVLSFHSPQQFTTGSVSELALNNPEGLRILAGNGRLIVTDYLSMDAGTLITNDALEINHQVFNYLTHTNIIFNGTGTWSAPVYRAPGSRIGLYYYHLSGTSGDPYIIGSRGEWSPNDTLYAFLVSSFSSPFISLEDIKVAAKIASRFRLSASLQMAPGKSVIFTESNFLGATPMGFPGPATSNISNNGHVSGGAGVAFRLNGTNLNRVWPVGVDGKQFVVGMYGINASNALVRVSAFRSEQGQAGAGLSAINPLYRYKVEVLEGTLEKVDSINLGFNAMISGFIDGDQNNRRVTASNTVDGTYENIGGPTGGYVVQNAFRPEWDLGWVRSDPGNYNSTNYYALGVSTGKFAVMWKNNAGGSLLWDDPANWTGNAVPTVADPVIIHARGTTITVSDNSACKQLTITDGTILVVPPGVNFKIGG
jgi:hypothetical protein